VLAFFNATLTSAALGPDVTSDVATAALKLDHLVRAFSQNGGASSSAAYPTSGTNFVLLRDYTYAFCMLLAPVVLMRIYRQWDRLSRVPAALRANDCFRADLSDAEYRAMLEQFRSATRSPWLNVGSLVVAIVMVALIYRQ